MINYKYFDLFLKNSIPKQIMIEFDGITLTNDDLYNQEMTLEESLCSEEELRFGSCEASVLKFKISNIFLPMVGKWLDVKMVVDGNSDAPFPIGKYKVDSDKIAADRKYREIVAYDAMHGIINSSVINWYNTILPDKNSKVTMKQFRTSFVRYFGLEQQEVDLVNDDMVVEKTIQVEEGSETDTGTEQVSVLNESALGGLDVITAICEINACFGHIGRDGKFRYIYLPQDIGGVYPSDGLFPDHAPEHLPQSKTGHLYPQDPDSYRVDGSEYIECDWEKIFTKPISRLQIRNSENEIGKVWPEEGLSPEDNCYIIEDNFLVYGKSDQQLREIARNIFEKITDIVYMPFSLDVIGNPCIEVGDAIRVPTKYDIVESYVLQRTLKGIQALRDEIGANGVEKYGDKVNGLQKSILQLKGKTNTLIRTVDETKIEMRDTDKKLATDISILSGEIVLKVDSDGNIVQVSLKADPDIGTIFKVNADNIDLTAEEAINFLAGGTLNLTGKKIKIESENFSVDEEGNLTAINAVIKGNLSGSTINNGNGNFSVDEEGNLTAINAVIKGNLSGSTINNGNGNFSVDEEGNVKMLSAEITGKITGSEIIGSEITGSKITGGEISGATIKAKEGLYLQYRNANMIPAISGEYVFAETGYGYEEEVGGLGKGAYLCINTPAGGTAMVAGIMGMGINFGNMAYFPEGAIMHRAEIRNMLMTLSMENSFIAEEGETVRYPHEAYLQAKVFGVFVCVHGKYRFHEHGAGKTIDISVGSSGDPYIPKWANVEVCTSYKGNPFVFILRTDGTLRVVNASGKDAVASGEDANSYITINFRFDFIRT